MKDHRQAAILTGDKLYFTGKPCKRGHVSPRYTMNAICVECAKLAMNKRRKMEKELYGSEKNN